MNVKRLASAGLAVIGMSAAFAQQGTEPASATAARAADRGLTRAEVLADLQMWKHAGLPIGGRGQAGVDVNAPDYQAAYARYLALRAQR
jgi:Domain of unknown function (DUF4148)